MMSIQNLVLRGCSFTGSPASIIYKELNSVTAKVQLLAEQIKKITSEKSGLASACFLSKLIHVFTSSPNTKPLLKEKLSLENKQNELKKQLVSCGIARLKQVGIAAIALGVIGGLATHFYSNGFGFAGRASKEDFASTDDLASHVTKTYDKLEDWLKEQPEKLKSLSIAHRVMSRLCTADRVYVDLNSDTTVCPVGTAYNDIEREQLCNKWIRQLDSSLAFNQDPVYAKAKKILSAHCFYNTAQSVSDFIVETYDNLIQRRTLDHNSSCGSRLELAEHRMIRDPLEGSVTNANVWGLLCKLAASAPKDAKSARALEILSDTKMHIGGAWGASWKDICA